MSVRYSVGCLGLVLAACTRAPDPPDVRRAPDLPLRLEDPVLPTAPVRAAAPPASASPAAAADEDLPKRFPWLAGRPLPTSSIDRRFAPPPGFARVALPPESFGAWLRTLPLEPEGTPVRSHRGAVILGPEHPNLAAVVALDVGAQDLQQCADSVIRLHAEWRWSEGHRDQSYRAASGAAMPWSRWARGERIQVSGPAGSQLDWIRSARPDSSHAAFRSWLDAVFAWANTGSLARDTVPVELSDLRPGDFVVQPGSPGHTVLVLDLAVAPDGRRVVLLGQGYMPAQSFQVLRPSATSTWFVIDEAGLDTPFWPRFPWKALHRFDGT